MHTTSHNRDYSQSLVVKGTEQAFLYMLHYSWPVQYIQTIFMGVHTYGTNYDY